MSQLLQAGFSAELDAFSKTNFQISSKISLETAGLQEEVKELQNLRTRQKLVHEKQQNVKSAVSEGQIALDRLKAAEGWPEMCAKSKNKTKALQSTLANIAKDQAIIDGLLKKQKSRKKFAENLKLYIAKLEHHDAPLKKNKEAAIMQRANAVQAAFDKSILGVEDPDLRIQLRKLQPKQVFATLEQNAEEQISAIDANVAAYEVKVKTRNQNLSKLAANLQQLHNSRPGDDGITSSQLLESQHATVNANANVTINANANVTVNANANATVNADVNATANADANATVSADANATANAHANADANTTANADANATANADANATANADAAASGEALITPENNATAADNIMDTGEGPTFATPAATAADNMNTGDGPISAPPAATALLAATAVATTVATPAATAKTQDAAVGGNVYIPSVSAAPIVHTAAPIAAAVTAAASTVYAPLVDGSQITFDMALGLVNSEPPSNDPVQSAIDQAGIDFSESQSQSQQFSPPIDPFWNEFNAAHDLI